MKKLAGVLLLGIELAAAFVSGCDVIAGPMGCPGVGMEYGHTPTDGTIAGVSCLPAFGNRALDGCGILVGADGIVIDPDHVHGWARITIAMYKKAYATLDANEPEFSSDFVKVELKYPENWESVSEADRKEIALQIAEYAAFADGVWHETASWYGYNSLIFPDFESAFSYEDIYCDLLGAKIGVEAIRKGGNVTANVTTVRNRHFRKFKLLSRDRAMSVINKGKGTHWGDKASHFDIRKPVLWRNMDIGTSDGFVNPTIIPVNANSEGLRQSLALEVPKLDLLAKHGVEMKLTIGGMAPKVGTVKRKLGINRPIEPAKDYPKVIEIIAKDAVKRGFNIDM